jgi:hypothetical protein
MRILYSGEDFLNGYAAAARARAAPAATAATSPAVVAAATIMSPATAGGRSCRGATGADRTTPSSETATRSHAPTAEATDESLSEDGNKCRTAERTLAFSESLRRLRAIAAPAVA